LFWTKNILLFLVQGNEEIIIDHGGHDKAIGTASLDAQLHPDQFFMFWRLFSQLPLSAIQTFTIGTAPIDAQPHPDQVQHSI
jgi:hypothetical protein